MAVAQPGGMPRSRQYTQFDEYGQPINRGMSGFESPTQRPGANSSASMNRRVSTSSNASGRGFLGFGRSKSKLRIDGDFGEDDWENAGGDGDNVPDLSMGALSELRDRDRYPTMGGPPGGPGKQDSGRTMSISSTTSFDTTPLIPVFAKNPLSKESGQNAQYRKNLTNSRKQALRTSDGVPYPPPMHAGPYRQPPPGGPAPYRRGPPPGSVDPRLRTMNGPPPEFHNYPNGHGPGPGPGAPYGNRAMSMSSSGYPDQDPNGQFNMRGPSRTSSRPPSRLSQGTNYGDSRSGSANGSANSSPARNRAPMVDNSTMIEVPALESSSMQTDDSDWDIQQVIKEVPVEVIKEVIKEVPVPIDMPASHIVTPEAQSTIDELRKMNEILLNEVRLVTAELADSLRRELGVSPEDALESKESDTQAIRLAQQLVLLEKELDLERHKRLMAEGHTPALEYTATEYEAKAWEMERLYKNEHRENQHQQENIEQLTAEYDKLELETHNLKNGILPELRSHVKDLEVLTAAGNPIELLKQIDELKVENKKMQDLVEENSTRGPLGDKIKTVESQRDALREALRSQRERKDHEIRQATERVRQLEAKLEKEKVITNQMQRKLVQTRTASGTYMSPTANGFPPVLNGQLTIDHSLKPDSAGSSSYSSTDSSPVEQGIPKRRGVGAVPGIVPPAPFTEFGIASMGRPASPVSFEISQDPTWLDYVDPSRIGGHTKQFSNGSSDKHSPVGASPTNGIYGLNMNLTSSSLSLPNGRSEQLPLSLGDMVK
jgi:hypothetical protein